MNAGGEMDSLNRWKAVDPELINQHLLRMVARGFVAEEKAMHKDFCKIIKILHPTHSTSNLPFCPSRP